MSTYIYIKCRPVYVRCSMEDCKTCRITDLPNLFRHDGDLSTNRLLTTQHRATNVIYRVRSWVP